MSVAAVIVTYNSADEIGPCLTSLASLPEVRQTVVIDNASQDHTVVAARAHAFDGLQVVANVDNKGFAGGVNQGVAQTDASGRYLLILNPDTQILSRSLKPMETLCEQYGLACGLLVDDQENPQEGFWARRLPTPASLLFEVLGVNRLWPKNRINRQFRCLDLDPGKHGFVEQPPGACLMVRRDVWELLGGMDERFYPVWFEDADFCRRAFDSGFRIAYSPDVKVRHRGGHSVLRLGESLRNRLWYGSLLRYSAKHFSRVTFRVLCVGVMAGAAFRAVAIRGTTGMYAEIIRMAAASFFRGNVALTRQPAAGASR
ncbi:hypothetical protein F183_A01880 [Bryobacterales bacterium F-183]|nr:hypothetical protein F183_A01880 [Bryobacterales bacterium F-183]